MKPFKRLRRIKPMDILSYDDFFYDVWETVSYDIVPSRDYDRNKVLIREMTFGFYHIYKNTCTIEGGYITSEMLPKRAAKLFEEIFSAIKKIGIKL